MNIDIYTIGGPMEKFYVDSISEYEKRLSRYCKTHLFKDKTLEKALKRMPTNAYIIAVSTKGVSISSENLAKKISQLGLQGTSNVVFIIGLNYEVVSETNIELLNRVNETISLTSMEMSLGLQTTILYEQIYRAYRIINNHPYHK